MAIESQKIKERTTGYYFTKNMKLECIYILFKQNKKFKSNYQLIISQARNGEKTRNFFHLLFSSEHCHIFF